MFFRIKPSGERRYLQIVENTRDGAATRQCVVATLGRVEELEACGKLDALLRSGARLCETALLISSQHLDLTNILHTQMQHNSSWLETYQARVRSAPVPGQDKHHACR